MADLSIRRLNLAEEAERAARLTVETGERQPNPYAGTEQEQQYRSLYERWLVALSAPAEVEGGC